MSIVLSFDYIHVVDCSCKSDYAERLASHRQEFIERIGSEEEAAQYIPDGACLEWLDEAHRGQGWPCDHRDYHLIRLYEAALRLKGAGAAAWAQVEAVRASQRERPSFDAWNKSQAEKNEDDTACAAHEAAERSEREAANILAIALQAAPWGAQPDGSFVTRQTAHQVASGRYVHTLHAPCKQGPIAEALDPESWVAYQSGEVHLTALRTREEARLLREEEREKACVAQLAYDARRKRAGDELRDGKSLPYVPGQERGTVAVPVLPETLEAIDHAATQLESGFPIEVVIVGLPVEARREVLVAFWAAMPLHSEGFAERLRRQARQSPVSAVGALRSAGLTRNEAEHLLDESQERLGLSYESSGGLVLTLRGVERRDTADE